MKTIGWACLALFLFVVLAVFWVLITGLFSWFLFDVLNWWVVGFLLIFFNLECISLKATKTNELLAKLVEIKGGGE